MKTELQHCSRIPTAARRWRASRRCHTAGQQHACCVLWGQLPGMCQACAIIICICWILSCTTVSDVLVDKCTRMLRLWKAPEALKPSSMEATLRHMYACRHLAPLAVPARPGSTGQHQRRLLHLLLPLRHRPSAGAAQAGQTHTVRTMSMRGSIIYWLLRPLTCRSRKTTWCAIVSAPWGATLVCMEHHVIHLPHTSPRTYGRCCHPLNTCMIARIFSWCWFVYYYVRALCGFVVVFFFNCPLSFMLTSVYSFRLFQSRHFS